MSADVRKLPACPVETALSLISDKWKVLIVRDLLGGGEVLRDLGGRDRAIVIRE